MKCQVCGSSEMPIYMVRPAIHDGYETRDGKTWAKYRPGEPQYFCAKHKPKEEPNGTAEPGTDT